MALMDHLVQFLSAHLLRDIMYYQYYCNIYGYVIVMYLSSTGIVRLPKMYANFVEDEYMSVFAIALPYTNPFKYV